MKIIGNQLLKKLLSKNMSYIISKFGVQNICSNELKHLKKTSHNFSLVQLKGTLNYLFKILNLIYYRLNF